MAEHLRRQSDEFDGDGFVAFCIEGIDLRELKQRSNRIVAGLEMFLPKDFCEAAKIITASLDSQVDLKIDANQKIQSVDGIRGWAIMPLADYVALRGQEHVLLSLELLKQLTMRWSSEFAIRPFLKNHPQIVLPVLMDWTKDKNAHVRRLVSEGTRPLLPWGMRLHQFVEAPQPVLELLEILKDDGSEFVRRSVANNLNDISKNQPDLVAQTAVRWMKDASKPRQQLVRHGLRGLIKQGHVGALAALGYGPAKVNMIEFEIITKQLKLGEELVFELEIISNSKTAQPLILDFAIHHQLANGSTSPKVFKWKNFTLAPGENLKLTKRHRIKSITTRKYYSGEHGLEILLNGAIIAQGKFELKV